MLAYSNKMSHQFPFKSHPPPQRQGQQVLLVSLLEELLTLASLLLRTIHRRGYGSILCDATEQEENQDPAFLQLHSGNILQSIQM